MNLFLVSDTMDQGKIQIDRSTYTQSSLDVTFKLREPELPSVAQRLKQSVKKKFHCSPHQCAQSILGLFPFIGHLKGYRYENNFYYATYFNLKLLGY